MKERKKYFCTLISILLFAMPFTAQSSRPVVSSISTSINNTNSAILISWEIPQKANFDDVLELHIYRQNKEFDQSAHISTAELIGMVPPNTTLIVDPVTDYSNYWYAVIAKKIDGSLFDILVPSVNTSVLPSALIPPQKKIIPAHKEELAQENMPITQDKKMRETPLPCLHILPNQSKQEAGILSPKARLAAEKLNGTPIKETPIPACLLKKEKSGSTATGSDYSLYHIIDSYFVNENWYMAETELLQFLQVARPDETAARAYFYLGQSYYFQNKHRDALNSFLIAEKMYKPESRKWLELTLNNLEPEN